MNAKALPSHTLKQRDQNYIATLKFGDIADVEHPHFTEAHALFSMFFHNATGGPVLDRQDFNKLFSYNEEPAFQNAWGPMRLMLSYAYDPAEQRIVGGTTYVAMVLPEQLAAEAKVDVLYLGATLFVAQDKRGQGLALELVDQRERAVCEFTALARGNGRTPASINLLAFNEQNDPRKMTLPEIEEDITVSGIHPCDRMVSSRRTSGWRTIDARFNYIEIARPDDPGVSYMTLGVKGLGNTPPPETLPTGVLCHFLRSYAVRRRVGADPELDPVFREQIRQATSLGTLKPVDDSYELEVLRTRIEAARKSANPVAAFNRIKASRSTAKARIQRSAGSNNLTP